MDPLYGQKTTHAKLADKSENWILVDATDQVLGRLASKVAMRLQGKHSPLFTPGVTVGDAVAIVNLSKIIITGKKAEQRQFRWYTGFPGGLKSRTLGTQMNLSPEQAFMLTLKGMLPKNSYGRKLMRRIRLFAGADHNVKAQNPKTVNL